MQAAHSHILREPHGSAKLRSGTLMALMPLQWTDQATGGLNY